MEERERGGGPAITEEELDALRHSQQGELDAVLMYEALAAAVEKKHLEDAAVFRQLASEEGHHAAVFRGLSGETLLPKKTKAFFLPKLYRVLGRRRLYPLIAKGEYAADEGYAKLAERFPEVMQVKADETRHGDTVMALLEETDAESQNSPMANPLFAAGAFCALTGAVVISLAVMRRYKRDNN